MSFFSNDAVNRVNLHTAVQALAQQGGGIFVFVFLLRAGVPAPLVLCVLAAMVGGRFVLRPLVLPMASRLGLRASLVIGTVLEAAIFPMLPFVLGPGPMLLAVIAVSASGSVIYWTCYHAYFAALGDAEHRGRQVGMREALSALAGVVAPAVGGWALATAGPAVLFGAAAVVQVLAAAPLLGAPKVAVAQEVTGGVRERLAAGALVATDGWFGASFYYLWQIGLFVSLGEHFADFGGAMALAGLAGAAGSLLIGRLIDLGHGRRSVLIAYACVGSVMALKAASLASPAMAVAANALGAAAAALIAPALMSRVYNLAKASPCPLRFHIATEGGYDLGCGLGCLAAAALLAAHQPMSLTLLLGLGGVAATVTLLLNGYRSP